MGNDGGVKAVKRDYFVKVRKRAEVADGAEQARVLWRMCSLTGDPIRLPIVTDRCGNIMDKLAVVDYILKKKKLPAFTHLRDLKAVKELKLTPNPSFDASTDVTTTDSHSFFSNTAITGRFMCPISNLDTNGKNKFVALWTCGHVFSERAMEEVKPTRCLTCDVPFTPADIVKLCPPDEDAMEIKVQLEAEHKAKLLKKKAAKAAKKAAKAKGAGVGAGAGAGAGAGGDVETDVGKELGAAAPVATTSDGSLPVGSGAAVATATDGDAEAGADADAEPTPAASKKAATKEAKRRRREKAERLKKRRVEDSRVAIADSTIHAGAVAKEAEALAAETKGKSAVYASLFNSSRKSVEGDEERKNLFMRTATAIYNVNRG